MFLEIHCGKLDLHNNGGSDGTRWQRQQREITITSPHNHVTTSNQHPWIDYVLLWKSDFLLFEGNKAMRGEDAVWERGGARLLAEQEPDLPKS